MNIKLFNARRVWHKVSKNRRMKEETIENIRRDWKVQTFQYDYISHLKYGFSFTHFMIFTSSFFLMFVHTFLGLLAIPCMVSWNYFVFFDKSRKVYKDSYVPMRYELIGTLFTTILYCAILGMFCFGYIRQCESAITPTESPCHEKNP